MLLFLRPRFAKIQHSFAVAFLAASLAACSPIVDQRGHVQQSENESQIKADQTTKEDTLRLLGSPSSTSNFGDESWYYISARKETKAFLRPAVVDQNVLRITFGSDGVVKKIEKFNKADGKKIDFVKRTTPTEGHSLGVAEQLLGNLGRFNKSPDKATAASSRSRSRSPY